MNVSLPRDLAAQVPDTDRQRAHGRRWRLALVALAVALVVLFAGYWQTVQSLVWVWAHDGTYQYAFLIFPLSAWVTWSLRDRIRTYAPLPSVWGLLAVAGLVGVWYIGHVLAVNLLQHAAFVAMFPALVLACWGWRVAWACKFPLTFLVVFAVPWGDGLVGPLQDITARLAVWTLDLTGMPVYLNGRQILTPSATWLVAEACSGVKFFFACTALGCLYAYLMYQRAWKRVLFMAMAAVVPVVANGLRVYFTIMIGEKFGMHYATGTDHMIFGWQFFGTVLILLLLVGWFFRDGIAAPVVAVGESVIGHPARRGLWLAVPLLLLAGPLLAVGLQPQVQPQALSLQAPRVLGWHASVSPAGGWQPRFDGAAAYQRLTYRTAEGTSDIEVFQAAYTGRPRPGHSLIAFGNSFRDPAHSTVLATASRDLVLGNGMPVRVRELRLATLSGARIVWYWYCVDDSCTSSPIMVKLLRAWQVLRGASPQATVWALSMPVPYASRERVRTRLRAFARGMPGPQAWLGTAGRPKAVGGRP